MSSALARAGAALLRLAQFFGGSGSDGVDIEPLETALATFAGSIALIDAGEMDDASRIAALAEMDGWLAAHSSVLPFPVTGAVVDKMMELAASRDGDDEAAQANELTVQAIRDRYSSFLVLMEDDREAMYAGEDAEPVEVRTADTAGDAQAGEAARTIELAEQWKMTREGSYLDDLVALVEPHLGDAVLELRPTPSLALVFSLARRSPEATFFPSFPPRGDTPVPQRPAECPANLAAPIEVDPNDPSFYHRGRLVRNSRKTVPPLPETFSCVLASCIDSLRYQASLVECVLRGCRLLVRPSGKAVLWTCIGQEDAREWEAGILVKESDHSTRNLPLPSEAVKSDTDPTVDHISGSAAALPDVSIGVASGHGPAPDAQGEELEPTLRGIVDQHLVPLAWRCLFRHASSELVPISDGDGHAGGPTALLVLAFVRDEVSEDDDVDLTVF